MLQQLQGIHVDLQLSILAHFKKRFVSITKVSIGYHINMPCVLSRY
jgi:hypothetical protein